MIIIALFVLIAVGIAIVPMFIPYLLVGYAAVNGVASRHFMNNLKVSVGSVNIFFADLLYAAAILLVVVGVVRLLIAGRMRSYAPLSRTAVFLVLCYFAFFGLKLVFGYFDGTPVDSLIRRFAADTQLVYMFIPLLYLKDETVLRRLLLFTIVITLLFPLVQPFLYGTADQVALEVGQRGTLRLGFGNANLLLMLGVLAFFVWEKRLWLSALPLAGIAMLAQRSAFVALGVCIIVLAGKKKKRAKFVGLTILAGVLLVSTLVVVQVTSSVPVVSKAAERLSQTFQDTGTTRARINVIPVIFDAFLRKPWVGYSYSDMNGFEKGYGADVLGGSNAFAFDMLHPHNFVLSSLVRTGLVGTALLFGIIAVVLLAGLRLSRRPEMRETGLYLFSTTLFFVIFGLMNTSFVSAGYIFWVLAGIVLWYLNQPRLKRAPPESVPTSAPTRQRRATILAPKRG